MNISDQALIRLESGLEAMDVAFGCEAFANLQRIVAEIRSYIEDCAPWP